MPRLLATFALLLCAVPLLAERIGTDQPHIVSVMRVDEDGGAVCRTLTASQTADPDYLMSAEGLQTPGNVSYAVSREGGIILEIIGDVPDEERDAIILAASIWDDVLVIDVPFVVRIVWVDMGYGLGSYRSDLRTGFTYINNGHLRPSFFPNALANQILGVRVNTSEPEFEIRINSGEYWHLGTEPFHELASQTPMTAPYSLIRMVLHGIGHAVGFISGATLNHSDKTAVIESPDNEHALIYDMFVTGRFDEGERGLSDIWWYRPDDRPRADRYGFLTKGLVQWGTDRKRGWVDWALAGWKYNEHGDDTMLTVQVNHGPVLLHWWTSNETASPVMHLHKKGVNRNGTDDLMTPIYYPGEVTREIGLITRAMLYDMGWHLTDWAMSDLECRVSPTDCRVTARERTIPDDSDRRRASRPGRSR